MNHKGNIEVIRKDGLPEGFVAFVKETQKNNTIHYRFTEFNLSKLAKNSISTDIIDLCQKIETPSADKEYYICKIHELLTKTIHTKDFLYELAIFNENCLKTIDLIIGKQTEINELTEENEHLREISIRSEKAIYSILKITNKSSQDSIKKTHLRILEKLQQKPATGLFEKEFNSMLDECRYCIESKSTLAELAASEIKNEIFDLIKDLPYDIKLMLWLDSEDAIPSIEWSLQEGYETIPKEDDLDMSEAIEKIFNTII